MGVEPTTSAVTGRRSPDELQGQVTCGVFRGGQPPVGLAGFEPATFRPPAERATSAPQSAATMRPLQRVAARP